jgi:hypothetical protein
MKFFTHKIKVSHQANPHPLGIEHDAKIVPYSEVTPLWKAGSRSHEPTSSDYIYCELIAVIHPYITIYLLLTLLSLTGVSYPYNPLC